MTPTKNQLSRFGQVQRRARVVSLATVAAMALAVPAMAVDGPADPSAGPTATPAAATPSSTPSSSPDPGTPGASPTLADPAAPSNPASPGAGGGSSLPSPTQAGASSGGGAGQHPAAAQAQDDATCTGPTWQPGKYHPGEPIPWLQGEGWPCFPNVPEPGNPYPFGVSNPPWLPDPQGTDLKVGAPDPSSCPAPAMPAPTEDTGSDGYTVPIRLKLSNGRVTGGYTPNAGRFGQFPFATWGTLTGWIVGSVSLPSLQVHVDPSGVVLCGGRFHLANPSQGFEGFETESLWGDRADDGLWYGKDGTWIPDARFEPVPGTFAGEYYPPSSPLQLRLKTAVAQSIQTSVSGVTADGRLKVVSPMAASIELRWFNQLTGADNANYCHFLMTGDMTTDPKKPLVPESQTDFAAGNPAAPAGGWTVGVPPAIPDHDLLPNDALSGAVEGGTARLGSNSATVEFVDGRPLCLTALPNALFGYDKDGLWQASSSAANGYPGYPAPQVLGVMPRIIPGLMDFGVDLTVDKVGLPKFADLPAGYGFE